MQETEAKPSGLVVVGLFAGIGGIELGLRHHGHRARLLCEIDEAAQAVLREHFMELDSSCYEPEVELVADVKDVVFPEATQLIAAGFPCTDVSQAGRTAGIRGKNTGLIQHVFRHIEDQAQRLSQLQWLLLENVPFLLHLDGGAGMHYLVEQLETHGFRWAYRVVDARAFGLPQRRHRVYLLASRTHDPRNVLLTDDAHPQDPPPKAETSFGFYWTEGLRGLGWAIDAVPTLKGGSAVGIASPPAIWLPDGRIVTPTINVAERLQGFDADWTLPMSTAGFKRGARWKAVGNAVSVPVSSWIGDRLRNPGAYRGDGSDEQVDTTTTAWPKAAWGGNGQVFRAHVSTWPVAVEPTTMLKDYVGESIEPLSARATHGFLSRLLRSQLRQRHDMAFVLALTNHYLRQGGEPNALEALGLRHGPLTQVA